MGARFITFASCSNSFIGTESGPLEQSAERIFCILTSSTGTIALSWPSRMTLSPKGEFPDGGLFPGVREVGVPQLVIWR